MIAMFLSLRRHPLLLTHYSQDNIGLAPLLLENSCRNHAKQSMWVV